MNKNQIYKISIILTAIVFIISPTFVSAGPSAGIKPNSIFYFFDTASEKIGLFFTFDSEKKAQKALEYADERLAEAEESANDNKPKDVKKAMEGYKKEISFATEKSKELKDETKAEELLNIVSENTAKHQEVLKSVLEKVPEEAKQAILNAIEVSKRGQEEAQKQISNLEKEVVRLKKELEEVKGRLENKDEEVLEAETAKAKAEAEKYRLQAKQIAEEKKIELIRQQKIEQLVQEQKELLQENLIFCNDVYWKRCPEGYKFYCPVNSGQAQCVWSDISTPATSEEVQEDNDFMSILDDINRATKPFEYDGHTIEIDFSGNKSSNEYSQPIQQTSPSDDFHKFIKEQEQKTFNRETCERLGGTSIGDTCQYFY